MYVCVYVCMYVYARETYTETERLRDTETRLPILGAEQSVGEGEKGREREAKGGGGGRGGWEMR